MGGNTDKKWKHEFKKEKTVFRRLVLFFMLVGIVSFGNVVAYNLSYPYGSQKIDSYCEDFEISGDYIYVASYSTFLTIVDISEPTSPKLVSQGVDNIDTEVVSLSISIQDDYAYIGCDLGKIYIVNVSDVSKPKLVTSYYCGDEFSVYDSSIQGECLYLIGDDHTTNIINSWVHIVNISVPYDPVGISTIPGNFFKELELRYPYLYFDTSSTIYIYDVSTPSSPIYIDGIDLEHLEWTIEGNSTLHVIGNFNYTLIDISTPSSYSILGDYNFQVSPISIAVSGSLTFIGCDEENTIIVSHWEDGTPHILLTIAKSNYVSQMAFTENYFIFVKYNTGNIYIIDMLRFHSPQTYFLSIFLLVETSLLIFVSWMIYVKKRRIYIKSRGISNQS